MRQKEFISITADLKDKEFVEITDTKDGKIFIGFISWKDKDGIMIITKSENSMNIQHYFDYSRIEKIKKINNPT